MRIGRDCGGFGAWSENRREKHERLSGCVERKGHDGLLSKRVGLDVKD